MAEPAIAELADRLLPALVQLAQPLTEQLVAAQLHSERVVIDLAGLAALHEELQARLLGYGELAGLIAPGVTDVLVNGADSVWVDSGCGLQRSTVAFDDSRAVRRLAMRLAGNAGRRLDDAQPFVDALLPDGVRLQAALPPIAVGAPVISLRVPAARPLPMALWLDGIADRRLVPMLQGLVSGRVSFVISGATGAGKTTLLRSILSAYPESHRVVCVEDVQELALQLPNVVMLQAREANAEGAGRIPLADLVRHTLRMRPDSIVVGEVRGPEVLEWLLAVSSGHAGSATTVHADSAAHALQRLLLLAELAGVPRSVAARVIADAVSVIVHCRRNGARREVVEVCPVSELLPTESTARDRD